MFKLIGSAIENTADSAFRAHCFMFIPAFRTSFRLAEDFFFCECIVIVIVRMEIEYWEEHGPCLLRWLTLLLVTSPPLSSRDLSDRDFFCRECVFSWLCTVLLHFELLGRIDFVGPQDIPTLSLSLMMSRSSGLHCIPSPIHSTRNTFASLCAS